jgi:hypothetical protein
MRARVAAASLAMIAIAVPWLVTSPGSAAGSTGVGRQSRGSDVAIAGADVYLWSEHRGERSGGGCTVSFPVRSLTSHRLGVLTAGHCVQTLHGGPAYLVHQTRRLSSKGTSPGDLLGRVARGSARLGEYGDNAFVRLVAHRSARPRVFVGPVYTSKTIPIAGRIKLRTGLSVCYSGAASGEHCGFTVVGGPETVIFKEGKRVLHIHHEWRATSTTCTSRRGDSGSPVYVRQDGKAYAVGILSGGQEKTGQCPFFFTPVVLALQTLHLKLLTQ